MGVCVDHEHKDTPDREAYVGDMGPILADHLLTSCAGFNEDIVRRLAAFRLSMTAIDAQGRRPNSVGPAAVVVNVTRWMRCFVALLSKCTQ